MVGMVCSVRMVEMVEMVCSVGIVGIFNPIFNVFLHMCTLQQLPWYAIGCV